MVCIAVAYVEGRDEADRGTSNQPLTQVSKSARSYRRMPHCCQNLKRPHHGSYFIKPVNIVTATVLKTPYGYFCLECQA